MRTFVFLCATTTFGLTTNALVASENTSIIQQSVSGTITDANGQPIPGVNVLEKGTSNGVQTDFDGGFSITPSSQNATLVFSYVGFKTLEVAINNQTNINITLEEDISQLDEVVVVGYGTQKKVNLTAAVSQVGAEVFENRATATAARSLQGTVPGLVISNSISGGEPGASPDINIRGFITASQTGAIGDAGPLVLIDGVQMNLSDIDPESIESVSVLKDAAAASIYGSRAAGGAILVTTKSGKGEKGKVRVNYSNNFSFSRPSQWTNNASAINYAYAINDSRANNNFGSRDTAGRVTTFDETELSYIMQNMENPGSAPTIGIAANNSNAWDTNGNYGGTSATDWEDYLFDDFAERRKHNLSISGGDEKLNYYVAAGAYDETGLLTVGNESFQRYNLDAKFSAKANNWLTLELYTKFLKSFTDFPTEASGNQNATWNKSFVLSLVNKIKPTFPLVDPIHGGFINQTYFGEWASQRNKTKNNQIVIQPRIVIEPIKDLKFNAQLNYRRSNNLQEIVRLTSQHSLPESGLVDLVTQENTFYRPTFRNTEYFSPNLFATYDKSIGGHNFNAMVGYQSEVNKFHAISTEVQGLTSDNVVSISTSSADNRVVDDAISHWALQSVFSRFRYNYKEKYLLEFSYRRDGSSRFAPEDRWGGFPSFSAGYNIAKEDFWSLDAINTFKLRGSYGELGNQNVANYLYLTSIDADGLSSYLFDGAQQSVAGTPGLESQSLGWETVKTTDIGFDLGAFNNKLNVGFSWYRTDIENMAARSLDLPAQLGTAPPLSNIGTSRVQGWEVEASWRQQISDDFSFNVRAVLSDYKRTIVDYPNETNTLNDFFEGQDLGDIWGLTWDGWFMTDDEYATNYTIDQSFVAGAFNAGDTKYADLDGSGEIDRGEWVVGDTGDFKVIGNTTPRYQYSINLGFNYKNFDFNAFIQGVGKRDVYFQNQIFRGPAQGAFHANVWEEHLDYFRGETTVSPLGVNTDAYFPAPYSANPGRNNRNYRYVVDRYLQNGAYARLKSMQIGFSIPKKIINKYNISNFRIFITGENLFTISDMMFFDPEVVQSNGINTQVSNSQSYPLSTIISTGINISF